MPSWALLILVFGWSIQASDSTAYRSTPGSFVTVGKVGVSDPERHTNRSKVLFRVNAQDSWTGLLALNGIYHYRPWGDFVIRPGTPPRQGDRNLNLFSPESIRHPLGYPFAASADGFDETNASWFLLFEGYGDQHVSGGYAPATKGLVDLALQQTIQASTGEWTESFTPYSSQFALMRIQPNDSTPFAAHTVVSIQAQRPDCSSALYVGYDRIPERSQQTLLVDGFENFKFQVEAGFLLSKSARNLYLLFDFKSDCQDFSIKVSKKLPDSFSDVQFLPKGAEKRFSAVASSSSSHMMYACEQSFRSLKFIVTDFEGNPIKFSALASQGNFEHYADGATGSDRVWIPSSIDYKTPWTFYFQFLETARAIVSLEEGHTLVHQSVNQLKLNESPSAFYIEPNSTEIVCLNKDQVNIQFVQDFDKFDEVKDLELAFFPSFNVDDRNFICLANIGLNSTRGTEIWLDIRDSCSHSAEADLLRIHSPVVSPGTDFHIQPEASVTKGQFQAFSFRAGRGAVLVLDVSACDDIAYNTFAYGLELSSTTLVLNSQKPKYAHFTTREDASWLVYGWVSGSCPVRVDFPKPNEIRGLKPGGSKTIEVSTDYTGCSAEERCPVFIKVHTEVPVPAVQFHLSKAQDFMSGSFDFFPGPPGNGKSPLTFEGRVVSFGGSEVDQSPKSQNGTALLVPAAQYQGPSVSKAFYLAFILSDLSPVTVIATAPVWKTLDLSKTISIETSPIAQTWELPFQKDLYVVSVLVTQQDCTLGEDSGWLFGGGGLQTVTFENPEPRGLLCGVQEWFYSRGEFSDLPEQSSFFLVVPAFSSPGTVFLEKEPVQFICDDIISCHGNGICSRDDGQCKCLKGTGFSFSGDQCQTLHRGSTWVILIVIASIILSVCLGHLWCSNSRLRKDKVLPLLINEPSSQSPQRISVTLDHVSFVLPSGKELLKDVSAHLAAGSLSAVMGPSGSGKSTLLKVMNRSISCSSGKILLNGIVVEKVKNVTSVIACVPQDDILRPCLTVFETLLFSAELRLSPHYSLKEKRRLVEFILDCVGLVEQRNMLVGDIGASKLSGGQRKRVSIAQELIAFPSALFLDEPTSGLDSTAALSLISMLRNEIVQKLGITVCCVIHQPRYDILQLFDNVLVLETGTLRYFGSPALSALSEKLPRLPSMLNDEKEQRFLNPADVILDFVSEFKAPQFEAAPLSQDVLVSPQVPSFLSQVWVQIKRSSLEILRSTQQLVTMYGLTLFVALLLSFLYNQSRFAGPAPSTDVRKCPKIFQGLCASNRNDNFVAQASIVSLALGLAAAASSLTVFGGIEKKVYARESRSGVSNVAYLLAKEVTALPNLVLASLLFVSVFQWITATPISVVTFCIIAFGVYFSCSGAAYLFSVAFLDSISLILTVVYVAVMTSLSGAQPLLPELEKTIGGSLGKVIPSISYSRFSTEAFYLGVLETFKDIYDLDWAFSVHGYAFEDMTSCLLVPFVIGLVFRVVSGVVLIHGSSFQTFIQRVSKKAKPC